MENTLHFEPTRAAGLARVADFAERAGRAYAQQRNYDRGPGDRRHVSMLSPWIRHRLVREREVLAAVLERHAPSAAEKFIQEVYWRTYFKGWLEQHPGVWPAYRQGVDEAVGRLERDAGLADRYEAAVGGRTGIACFDAWARELITEGYLHNHARMWFASIWVYTLRLPWELGADFFYRYLLDGDPASNTLGWRWVCGLHTRGKTYLARPSNIARYTDGRFDPAGQLADQAPALEEDPSIAGRRTPVPWPPGPGAEDLGSFGLLVTEEDGHGESLPLSLPRSMLREPRPALGLLATDRRSPLPVGEGAHAFARGAIADAVSRLGGSKGTAGPRGPVQAAADGWTEALVTWAGEQRLDAVVTAYAPTGPVAEALVTAETALADAGVRLHRVPREHDRLAWPFADRGFFKLKKRIPELLAAAGLRA